MSSNNIQRGLIVFKKTDSKIKDIARALRAGVVFAAPTETAYGLLADVTNQKAVARVVKIKGREPGKPIALVAADLKMVRRYFLLTNDELRVASKFWPGPLTLLLKPKVKFPRSIVGPYGLVGVRVPGDKWLRALLQAVSRPLTATSANVAQGKTLYSAIVVRHALTNHGLRYLVDGGRLVSRKTSTVVKVKSSHDLVIYRTGAVSETKLKRFLLTHT